MAIGAVIVSYRYAPNTEPELHRVLAFTTRWKSEWFFLFYLMDTQTISNDKAKYKMLLGKALGLKAEGYILQKIAGNRLKDIGMNIKAYADQQEVLSEQLSENLLEAELLIEYIRLHIRCT